MIDEIFAREAIKDYEKRKQAGNGKIIMTVPETEAVVSMLTKGRTEFLPLLLNDADSENEEVNRIIALFYGRVAVKDLIIDGFNDEDAVYRLSLMTSPYAKGVIADLKKNRQL